jgi:hypothetical protein
MQASFKLILKIPMLGKNRNIRNLKNHQSLAKQGFDKFELL